MPNQICGGDSINWFFVFNYINNLITLIIYLHLYLLSALIVPYVNRDKGDKGFFGLKCTVKIIIQTFPNEKYVFKLKYIVKK